jgi:hypothetical protein
LTAGNEVTAKVLIGAERGRDLHLVLVLVLFSLGWLLSCSGHQAEEFLLLQEGKGWQGKFSLGDSGKDALRLLGKPAKQQEDKSWRYYDYDFAEIAVDTKTEEIASILLRKRWRTAAGIGAGDSVEKILSTYGGIPYHPPILSYPKRGVSFALAPGEVTDVDGSKRPGWAAIWVRIFQPER